MQLWQQAQQRGQQVWRALTSTLHSPQRWLALFLISVSLTLEMAACGGSSVPTATQSAGSSNVSNTQGQPIELTLVSFVVQARLKK